MPESPQRPAASCACRGFTLLELLVVLGLIALLSGVVVMNSEALLQGVGTPQLNEQMAKSVREARYQAAYTKATVSLTFDEEEAEFRILSNAGQVLETIETELDPGDVDVRFFKLIPERGLRPGWADRQAVDVLLFHPDRSSTPFEVELVQDTEKSLHRYDLFSHIEIEAE